MKISEIICEDDSSDLTANLVPVLSFLEHRSKKRGLEPKMRTDSLIQFVQNAGDTAFDYDSLVAAYNNNPTAKQLLDKFTLISNEGEEEDFGASAEGMDDGDESEMSEPDMMNGDGDGNEDESLGGQEESDMPDDMGDNSGDMEGGQEGGDGSDLTPDTSSPPGGIMKQSNTNLGDIVGKMSERVRRRHGL